MRLGTVTYNIAADWDLKTILAKCTELGYEGVELRTTHAHHLEIGLTKKERRSVKVRFDDSPLTLVGLGSTFEFHSPDADELRMHIEGAKECILLAEDVGAEGVKVRPNAFPDGVARDKTIEQIGVSLDEIGTFAHDHGRRIRLEVHGPGTSHPPYIAQMLDIADNANVYACWNCNQTDKDDSGSIDAHFEMLKDRIDLVHMHELYEDYPYEALFRMLRSMHYDGFCLAEIQSSPDPERVLRYYKKLFETLSRGSAN